MKRSTKIIIIAGSVLGIALLVFFLWYFLLRTPEDSLLAPGSGLPIGSELPTTSTGGSSSQSGFSNGSAALISEHSVFDFWVNQETGEVFYVDLEGGVWSAKEGPDVEYSQQKLRAMNAITPSPKGTRILASFGDPHNPQWGIFDVIDAVWSPLPSTLLNVTWEGDEEALIGFVKDGDRVHLARVDVSSAQPKTTILVPDFRLLDVSLSFLSPSSLFLVERAAADYEGRVWKFDAATKTLNLILSRSGLLFRSHNPDLLLWSSKGNDFAVLKASTLAPAVPAPFVTFPGKCAAQNDYLACFAPRTLNPFPPRVIPDDYLKGAFRTADDLFFINLRTLGVSISNDSRFLDTAIDGWHPVIYDKTLYFLNKRDGKIYTTALPVAR